jgi:hypothetical protein
LEERPELDPGFRRDDELETKARAGSRRSPG